jgi:predicted outer membrane repeat protein
MFNPKLNKNIKVNTGTSSISNFNLQKLRHKRTFFTLTSLLFVMLLIFSIVYTATFNGDSPFVSAYTPDDIVYNELDLRAAVNVALGIAPNQYVIALGADIQLTTSTLAIPTNTNIVLINDDDTPRKLIGVNALGTLTVQSGSTLVLDGIIVTHNSDDKGRGVYVGSSAALILSSGEITGNDIYTGDTITDDQLGGGVYNWGTFTMNGGTISGNSAYNGGGLYSIRSFTMNGGTFSENTAAGAGGGVANLGTLVINNGTFYRNQAVNGAGVYSGVYSTFTLTNGAFLENIAVNGAGGGVYNDAYSTFVLLDGIFSKNKAYDGGGVFNLGIFKMSGGIIGGATVAEGNLAIDIGGGVCDGGGFSDFTLSGGVIAHNTADFLGGGVACDAGVFTMIAGQISDNHAYYGGGVYVGYSLTFNLEGGVISGNTAEHGGGVCNWGGDFNMFDNAILTGNVAYADGGGVYNIYYDFVMEGGVISGNTAHQGGGVYNLGFFEMFDGVISGNTVSGTTHNDRGGGVYNAGTDAIFNMAGGIIGGTNIGESNSAYDGGGVYNDHGTFTISGNAAILGNKASFGAGVYNDGGTFDLGASSSSEIVCISGNTAHDGGGVFNGGGAIFNMFGNAVISDNSGYDGAGVNNHAVFNMFGGEISGNSASGGGGGVRNSDEFTMYAGKISGNSANGAGGVLNYHIFNMLGGEISDNTAQSYGGGVSNNGSSALGHAFFDMSGDAIIANNTARFGGGGVYNDDHATFNMFGQAIISGNSATTPDHTQGRGGGVHNYVDGTFNMFDHAIISNNFATWGGGVYNDHNCTLNMSGNAALLDNDAYLYGGGVYNWNYYTTSAPSLVSLSDNAKISGNSAASYGGGVQNTNNGLLFLSGAVVISNNSALYGGGIYTTSALPDAVTINGGTIANNSASSGGGIYTTRDLLMRAGVIGNNTAEFNGGGVYVGSTGFFELLAGAVSNNVAGNNGGGIWITNIGDIDALGQKLYVESGVVFKDNAASVLVSLSELSVPETEVYRNQVKVMDGLWSSGQRFGINNYDISYTASCIVIYDPGEQGTWQPGDETYSGLAFGDSTPIFGTASGADYTVDHTLGWIFTGWLPAWSATVSGNVTYVAQWTGGGGVEPIFYTVRYDGNGYTGGEVPLGGYYPAGHSVLVAAQGSMVRADYVFQGWAYISDAKTPDFAAGSTAYLSLTGDVTLFAVWLEEGSPSLTYTISYLPGEYGTFEAVSFVCALGDLTPEAPVVTGQPGWSFIGWAPNQSSTVEGDATYVAQWKPETTPTPSPNPTATPTSSPTSTPTRPPTSTPSPTPTRPPTSTPSPTPTPVPTLSPSPSPTVSPPGENVDEVPVWALVNLILSVVGVILAILLTIGVLLQCSQKHTKSQTKQTETKNAKYADNQSIEETEVEKQKQRHLLWFVLSVILGIAGIIVFLFTEDLSRPMGLVDSWTIVNVIILAVQIIALIFTFKHKKDNTSNTEEPNTSTPTSNTQ